MGHGLNDAGVLTDMSSPDGRGVRIAQAEPNSGGYPDAVIAYARRRGALQPRKYTILFRR